MINVHILRKSLAAVMIAASTGVVADDSFEYNGYFRAGVTSNLDGGTSSGGSCYALSHPSNDGLYYRLGNECRDYGELQFTKNKTVGGIDFKGVAMLDIAGDNSNSTGTQPWSRRERQLYVEASNVFEDNPTKLWVGRRYYRAVGFGDVHIIDAFHVNSSGNGFGFTDIPLGEDNKVHLAFLAQGDDSQQNQLIDVRGDFGVGAAGRIKLGLQQLINNETDGVDTIDGNTITLQWEKNLGGVFDQKTVVQLGSDAFANNPGCWGSDGIGNGNCYNTDPSQDGLKGTRIFNNGTWKITNNFVMNTMVMFEDIEDTREVTSIGLRPHVKLSDHWSFLAELSFDEVEPEGGEAQKLDKVTLAVQVSGDAGDFWERPSLRLFVSQFDWNDAAATGSGLAVTGKSGQTDATIWGVQAEYWF